MKRLVWHVCILCRLPGSPTSCAHENTSEGRFWVYCEDCGACAEKEQAGGRP